MKTLALEHGTAGTQGENPHAGRIGPNAIIQLGEAVRRLVEAKYSRDGWNLQF